MKKFLGKMPVMITFVVVAVLVLALNIGMLARPVSYGMAYKGKMDMGEGVIEATVKFKNDKVAKIKANVSGVSSEMEMWVLRNGNKIALVGVKTDLEVPGAMDEEAYNTLVKDLKADKEEWDAFWNAEGEDAMYSTINAFRMSEGEEKMSCAGAVAYAVVMSIVEVALIAFAALSVVFFVQDKKTAKKAETTEKKAA